jgi:hypothetical protein
MSEDRVDAMAAHIDAATAAEAGDKEGFIDAAERLGFEFVEEDESVDDSSDWDTDDDDDGWEADEEPESFQPAWEPDDGGKALSDFADHASRLIEGSEWQWTLEDRRELLRQSHADGFSPAATEAAFESITADWDLQELQKNGNASERRAARQQRMANAHRRANNGR